MTRRRSTADDRAARAALRAKDKERLAALRAAVAAARIERRDRIRTARASCRDAARALKAKQKADRAAQRGSCRDGVGILAQLAAGKIKRTRSELADERGFQASMRRAARHARERAREDRARVSAAERRAESDSEVRNNLPPDLVPVFDKVRRTIKATPRRSRTETFLEWAQEHPAIVHEVKDAAWARDMRRLEREERELARAMKRGQRYKGCATTTCAVDDGELPF